MSTNTAVAQRELIGHLTDAVAMEENVERMLQSMISNTGDEAMRNRLERHLDETRIQRERLEGRLEAHDESSSGMKDMIAKAGATMKGAFDSMRSEKTGRNARDGYVTEHLEIAAYELLERVATMAGDGDTASVARTNRQEEEAMARFISEHWDDIARRSIAEAADED
jgi:ferritin-like metal-binding protein YciE